MAFRNALPIMVAILVLWTSACNESQPAVPEAANKTNLVSQARAASLTTSAAVEMSDGPTPATITLAKRDKIDELLHAARGKVLVLNVWATYCIPCIEEMPELAKFYKERDPERIEFISLSADPPYTLEDAVKPFVAEKQLPFPVYILDDLPPNELVKLIAANDSGWDGELPATFVLDTTGALKKYWLERVHLNDLSAAVTGALSG